MDTEKTRALTESLGSLLNPKDLIQSFGLFGIWAIIFAETGLLIGFFFPGDSLLFLAGAAASPVAEKIVGTKLAIVPLLIVTPIVATCGAQLGHFLGARYGRKMFQRPDSRLFRQEYVDKAEAFLHRFGPAKAIVLARFTPIVRTFMNPITGMLEVPARTFLFWNALVSVIWADGILVAGWLLAKQIIKIIPPEDIDTYLLPVIAVIVLISLIPMLFEFLRGRRERRRNRSVETPGGGRAAEADAGVREAGAGARPAATTPYGGATDETQVLFLGPAEGLPGDIPSGGTPPRGIPGDTTPPPGLPSGGTLAHGTPAGAPAREEHRGRHARPDEDEFTTGFRRP